MTKPSAAQILDSHAYRRAVGPSVMIVVAHPDDETIGMGAQLCRFNNALLVQITDGAPRDGRKRRMIDCFVSQRELLAPFGIEFESYRMAPDYDFAHPPHRGELYYERLGWGITGEVWRCQAKAALEALGLPPR